MNNNLILVSIVLFFVAVSAYGQPSKVVSPEPFCAIQASGNFELGLLKNNICTGANHISYEYQHISNEFIDHLQWLYPVHNDIEGTPLKTGYGTGYEPDQNHICLGIKGKGMFFYRAGDRPEYLHRHPRGFIRLLSGFYKQPPHPDGISTHVFASQTP